MGKKTLLETLMLNLSYFMDLGHDKLVIWNAVLRSTDRQPAGGITADIDMLGFELHRAELQAASDKELASNLASDYTLQNKCIVDMPTEYIMALMCSGTETFTRMMTKQPFNIMEGFDYDKLHKIARGVGACGENTDCSTCDKCPKVENIKSEDLSQ